MKERTERLGDATNPQNKKKEIAMKKRKSYAELEAVKKKLCLEWFCHYYTNTKRKTAKTYNPVSLVFEKK